MTVFENPATLVPVQNKCNQFLTMAEEKEQFHDVSKGPLKGNLQDCFSGSIAGFVVVPARLARGFADPLLHGFLNGVQKEAIHLLPNFRNTCVLRNLSLTVVHILLSL